MATAALTLTCLLFGLGQVAQDAWYTNERHFKIPITIAPALRPEIKGMILYVSRNKGQSWEQEAHIAAEDDGFVVHAPADGEAWYRVASINRAGVQDPANIFNAAETKKIIIDTLKPNVHIVAAQRQGDEVLVRWEIQE